jgi:hypothetical protein
MFSPLEQLEQSLIAEYIQAKGYDPQKLAEVSPDVRVKLLIEASVYASGKLVEVEARSHYLHDVHGDVPGTHKTRSK